MAETASVPPILNKTMKFLLRSPMHRVISKYLLLFTFTGRKSGKSYTTPVSYMQQDGYVTILTHANWWKNLCGGAPVSLRLRGRELQGMAELVVEDKEAVAAALTTHLRQSTFDAKFYDVAIDEHGNPIAEDVERAVQTVVMIQVRLC